MSVAQTAPARSVAARRPLGAAKWLTRAARALAREPLTHFVVIGAALFLAAGAHRSSSDVHRIVITPARVERLATQYRLQFGDPPSPAQLDALVARDIDEEVLYREGAALGLGRDDEIVRRRIVQKMQFLAQDVAAPAEPGADQLHAYYQSHLARYTAPAEVGFTHIYFSPDRGGGDAARARALKVLAALNEHVTRAPERGDPFADASDYAAFSRADAVRLFGETELAQKLFVTPVGRWAGPFQSGYGYHLVRVQSATPARARPFAAVADAVRADVIAEAQAARNRAAFTSLKAHYAVVREDRDDREPAQSSTTPGGRAR